MRVIGDREIDKVRSISKEHFAPLKATTVGCRAAVFAVLLVGDVLVLLVGGP
jgi:hypothetical protein